MDQTKTPNLKLTNIEFLCLKMAANPGQTGRWYLRELHRYRFGTLGEGSWNAIYMSPSGRYRGRLFIDESPKVRVARGGSTGTAPPSAASSFCPSVGRWPSSRRRRSGSPCEAWDPHPGNLGR